MKFKVFQTHFGTEKTPHLRLGNCMQAVFASLFSLSLDEVPHFIEKKDHQKYLSIFLKKNGYKFVQQVNNIKISSLPYTDFENIYMEDIFPDIIKSDGINGLFYGLVYSPSEIDTVLLKQDISYTPPLHAVIVDKNFNIVHDPNPAYKGIKEYPLAKEIGYNGIAYLNIINRNESMA
jgi:hypothetical protein